MTGTASSAQPRLRERLMHCHSHQATDLQDAPSSPTPATEEPRRQQLRCCRPWKETLATGTHTWAWNSAGAGRLHAGHEATPGADAKPRVTRVTRGLRDCSSRRASVSVSVDRAAHAALLCAQLCVSCLFGAESTCSVSDCEHRLSGRNCTFPLSKHENDLQ